MANPYPDFLHQGAVRSVAEMLAQQHPQFQPAEDQPPQSPDPYATQTAATGLGLNPTDTTFEPPPDSPQALIRQLLTSQTPSAPLGFKHPKLAMIAAALNPSLGPMVERQMYRPQEAAERAHQEKMANVRALLGYQQKEGDEFVPYGEGGIMNKRTGVPSIPSQPYIHAGNRPFTAGPYDAVYDASGKLIREAPVKPYAHGNTQWNPQTGKMEPIAGYQDSGRYKGTPQGIFDTKTSTYIRTDDPRGKLYQAVYAATMGNPGAWMMAGATSPQEYARTTALQALENAPEAQTGPLPTQGVGQAAAPQKTGVQRIRELMAQGMDVDAATAKAKAEGLK